MRRLAIAATIIGLGSSAPGAAATSLDPALVETPFTTTYPRPTALEWAPDGSNRLFVTQKTGRVWVIEDGQAVTTPFALITPIAVTSECGLLGIAFDPDFVSNGFVYLFVTVSVTEQQIIRYTAVGNTGTDKTVLVKGLPTAGANHDGGALGFGADGKLYWAVGDNGNVRSGTKGDLASLAAKVGRANRDGSAPSDNPFFDGDGPNNDYIWARGFRNPFTLTVQPTSGRLWLNVVGNELEQIFALKAGDHGGWDMYEGNQPDGYVPPRVSYYTGRTPSLNVTPVAGSGAVRVNGVVTIKTLLNHRFRPGLRVTIAGVADPSFDGTFIVDSVDGYKFSYKQAEPDAASQGGTVSSELVGNAVTGGVFWNSSAVPQDYRGDLLFGDYGSGNLMRVRLDENEAVKSVDKLITDSVAHVDMAIGPDGDLYHMTHAASITRVSYGFDHQTLVVTPLDLRMAEGGKAVLNVRLAQQPKSDVPVTVAWKDGDADVSVLQGASLTFTPQDWREPQTVLLAAAVDPDSMDDLATLEVSSGELLAETATIRVTDADSAGFFVEPTRLQVDEAFSASFQVSLTQPPSNMLRVAVAKTAGDPSVAVTEGASLVFDAQSWSNPLTVTVSAAPDSDGEDGTATLQVSADGWRTADVEVHVRDRPASVSSAGGEGGVPGAGGALGAGGLAPVDEVPCDEGGTPGAGGAPVGGEPSVAGGATTQGDGCDCSVPASPRGTGALAALALAWVLSVRRGPARRGRQNLK